MKIAVTAASGSLGSAIIKQLKKEIGSENIIGLARTPDRAKILDVEIRKGDYNNKADLVDSLQNVNALLLVSGMDHPDKRIQQHRNVIEAAVENGVSKVVYTSIVGAEEGNAFSPIVASNRQTEEDIRTSGLNWAIGRNGIYIEPDLEYINTYIDEGGIQNCAADGKCGYTSRSELAVAYSKLLTDDALNGGIYPFFGQPVTQAQLAEAINKAFNTDLSFTSVSVQDYINERKEKLGEFLGIVIGGIYQGIRDGKLDGQSDFRKVVGRPHKSLDEMIQTYKSVKQ